MYMNIVNEYINQINEKNFNLHFLVISGSHSYGLNTENSDYDLRGMFAYDPKELWTGKDCYKTYDFNKDQYDIVIHSFHKFLHLLSKANPSIITLLGTKNEHILICSDIALEIIKKKDIFLTKEIFKTFGGYANQCLSRIHKSYNSNNPNTISFSDPELKHRNRQKGDMKELYKHCCHLILLYYIGIDILTKKEIITYREKEHDLLMSIKTGNYPLEKIFILQEKLEKEFQNARDNTKLPDNVDYNLIYEFAKNSMESIYKNKYIL